MTDESIGVVTNVQRRRRLAVGQKYGLSKSLSGPEA